MRRPCPQCGTWRYVTPAGADVLCCACNRREGESPDRLEYGRWVRSGCILRWEFDDQRPLPDAPLDHNSPVCRRCRRDMHRGKRTSYPGIVWHAGEGYCQACYKHVRQEQVA